MLDKRSIQGTPFLVEKKSTPFEKDVDEDVTPRPNQPMLPLDSTALAVKVTQFSCGTLCVATSVHHQVTDLAGFMDFLELWSLIARSPATPIDFSKIPSDWTHTPSRFFPGLIHSSPTAPPPPGYVILPNPPTAPPAHLMAGSAITRWKLTKADVTRLKDDFSPSDKQSWISSGDAIATLLCSAVARSRERASIPRYEGRSTPESNVEVLAMAADGRERSPNGSMLNGQYLGNVNPLFFTTLPRSTLASSTAESLSQVAVAIRTEVTNQLSTTALASKISFFEKPDTYHPWRIVWSTDIIMTNWCKFDLSGPKLDVGWGKPFLATNGGGSFPPGYILTTQEKETGDISAMVTVEVGALEALRGDETMKKYATLVE
ncbi:hypothetical protein HDV00_001596 [Rhizophlyctis rosea]|nr:hypothetical protein HDV00_001596 [Rhizophlyctis rosea]